VNSGTSAVKGKWGAFALAGFALLSTSFLEAPVIATNEDPVVQSIVGLTVYPRLAHLSGVQGTVRLVARVNEDGAVESVRRVAGPGILSYDAERTLMKWKFRRCISVCGTREVEVTFEFLLEGECTLPDCRVDFEIDLPNKVTIKSQKARAIID